MATQLTIDTWTGDILKASVDAIVTGEGPDLVNESHVTNALLAKIPEFHERREELKKKNKHLPLWSVHVSKLSRPTHLQHKYVLHAVLTTYYDGQESQWLRDMVSLYNNIIKKADTLEIFSLAIPLLGAGRAEASARLSIEAAAKATAFAEPKYLTNVLFVSPDPQISELIKRTVKYEYKSGEPPHLLWRWTRWFDRFRDTPNMADFSETTRGKHSGADRGNRTRGQGHHQRYTQKDEDADLKKALALSKKESTPNVKHGNKERQSIYPSEIPRGKHSGAGRGNRHRGQGHHQRNAHKDEDNDFKRVLELSKEESKPNEDGEFNRVLEQSKMESLPRVEHRSKENTIMELPPDDEDSEALGTGHAAAAADAYGAASAAYGGGSGAAATDDDDDEYQEEEEENLAAVAADNNETLSRDPQHSEDTLLCPICLNTITDPKQLDKCRHIFCKDCIDRSFKEFKAVCPSCNMVYGILTGDQPDESTMGVSSTKTSLPGYEGHGTIIIEYHVPNGAQKAGHPHPGLPYKGTRRRAFLPDNAEGKDVLSLLRKAFVRKLTFTIGRSTTTGDENVATWNDIHHKTSIHGGPTRFGYPDPSYLTRVTDELASKGVTAKD